ncbi:MAG: hypothetical protein COA79_01780 [Planctomycetota bacterium]|nr:MAG: hypothetical protein COA79_01780 [Planctomycetota bacterium]
MARILIIEKKSSISMILQKIFDNVGHEVYSVKSCTEAVKFSATLDIDVVILNSSKESNSEKVAFGLLKKNYQGKHFIGLMEEELCFSMDVEIINGFDQKYFRPLKWENIIDDISKVKTSAVNAIRRNIMVVDDNENIHEDFKKILCNYLDFNKKVDALSNGLFDITEDSEQIGQSFDYHVISAYSGEEAIGIIKNHIEIGCPIDVIFMDIRMAPGMDGIDACCQIREIYPDADLIFCSAYSDYPKQGILNKVGNKNPVYFLPKPFETNSVHKILSQILCEEDVQIA